jgi:hypothetical protein
MAAYPHHNKNETFLFQELDFHTCVHFNPSLMLVFELQVVSSIEDF